MRIGVLALQGDFREHLDTLADIGVEGVAIRLPFDLDDVSALILPGGRIGSPGRVASLPRMGSSAMMVRWLLPWT